MAPTSVSKLIGKIRGRRQRHTSRHAPRVQAETGQGSAGSCSIRAVPRDLRAVVVSGYAPRDRRGDQHRLRVEDQSRPRPVDGQSARSANAAIAPVSPVASVQRIPSAPRTPIGPERRAVSKAGSSVTSSSRHRRAGEEPGHPREF